MKLQEKVTTKLDQMNQYLNELENLLPERDEYLENLEARRACEKTIELAIERVIDVLSVIIAEKRFGVPSSEENLIQIAQKRRVLSLPLAKKIQAMKGFRNILVHKYGEVDDEQAYTYLSEERHDFAVFEKEIEKFLKK